MAVTIANATMGIDKRGVQDYINKIRSEGLKKAGKSIENSTDKFKSELKKVWVGEAADEFAREVEKAGDALKNKLDKLYNELEKTFGNVVKTWQNFDKNQHTASIIK